VSLLHLRLKPGSSIFDQIVSAATKAFVSGEFQAGQSFPSVRTLAAELKIHPNTAQKVIQHLIKERYLDARPGLGTVVANLPTAPAGDRKRLLQSEVEQLVVEALRIGAHSSEVHQAIDDVWATMLARLDRTATTQEETVDTSK
jgi:GntR family transcriptional regulator